MMNSAYSIFKRPDLIAKDEPFLESGSNGFQAQVHYTPNLAQEINLSRIQRYPGVRGCFNGGAAIPFLHDKRRRGEFVRPRRGSCRHRAVGRYNIEVNYLTKVSPATTFKAPSGRQLIADKGSFDGGVLNHRPMPAVIGRIWIENPVFGVRARSRPTFRAALTERCFRYLDCFDDGLVHFRHFNRASRASIQGGPSIKAVSIPSSLDRNIKDNQGGCLYEWPTYNQIQALTTPVNLVGGALTCEPYLPLVGPKPPCKGGSYV